MIQTFIGFAVRFLSYAALLVVPGAVIFRLVLLHENVLHAETIARASRRAAGTVLASVLLLLPLLLAWLALQTAAMRFEDDPWTDTALRLLFETRWGVSWLAAFGGALFIVPAALYARSERATGQRARWFPVALLAAGAAIVPSTASHAMSAERFGAAALVADMLHICAASAWIGTLFVVWNSVRSGDGVREPGNRYVQELLRHFSPMAMVCAAIVVASGGVSALSHIETLSALTGSRYGVTLLAKIAAVGLVLFAGWRNWKYVTPALERDDSGPMHRGMREELMLAVVVLLLTAVLVVTPPPTEAMTMP